MAKKMPVITLTGPRQSGKTTLAKQCFPDYDYVNLEMPNILQEAISDPVKFLRRFKKGLIIDEAQVFPEIFSYIQALSDKSGKAGEYILTGSQNFLLSAKISQSLAGRAFVSHLLPFSINELKRTSFMAKLPGQFIFKGFYPRLYDKKISPDLFYPSYTQTYTERDVRQIANIANLGSFQKFMALSAGRIGQLLNYSELSNELGVDVKTIKSWFSILETSFIVFFLKPHYKNFKKRLVKSPKLYFYDTGLACNLLNIKSAEEVEQHWARGFLFENLVISDMMKNYFNEAQRPPLYFWRDNTGNELDCLVEGGIINKPVEIKSGTTIHPEFFKGLNYYNKLSKGKTDNSYLVYGGSQNYQRREGNVVSWNNTIKIL